MSDPVIVCPKCKTEIPLTSAIEGPIAERLRQKFEAESKTREAAIAAREKTLAAQRAELDQALSNQEQELLSRLNAERTKLAAEARAKAQSDFAVTVKDLEVQLAEQQKRIEAAQGRELEFRKLKRDLEQEKESLALEVTRRIDEERAKIKVETATALAADFQKKNAEKDQQLGTLRQQVAETQKQAETLAEKQIVLAAERRQLEQARQTLEAQIAAKLDLERKKISAEAMQQAQSTQAAEMKDLQTRLAEKDKKLADAQALELDLRKQRRDLEEQKASADLEMARKLDAERDQIKAAVLKAADEGHRLKEAEKEKQISDLRSKIDELQRKAEQGSQQLQGEVLELELERILQATFPHDQILPVPKGVYGGDVTHKVLTPAGLPCGTILWESKRTKSWSDGWIDKLKGDQRAAKADVAIIVSTTLPKDCATFQLMEGVWVTSRDCMISVAIALRIGLLQLADAKRAAEGKHEKMEVLYNYLSGHEFKQRVEAIVEAFSTMQDELKQEKTAMTKIWAKREKQLERVMTSTTGMYGDLAGIIGGALPAIDALELPALAEGNGKDKS
jgi:hypothetical protein